MTADGTGLPNELFPDDNFPDVNSLYIDDIGDNVNAQR
jgi:hypothetical protein